MKHFTFLATDKDSYSLAKTEAKNSVYKSQLIQIFTAITNKKDIEKLLKETNKNFPDACVVGTTTAGEISHAKMYDDSTVISLSLFKNTKLKTCTVDSINRESGQTLSSKICSKNTKAAIVLSEGLQGEDYVGFIQAIKKENPNVIIAGGLAGDNFALKQTYVFLGSKLYEEGAVAVSFSGKELYADNRYNLNWTPIGKEFTITCAEGNLIKEIDEESAVSIFKKYLGSEIFDNKAASLPDFQLLYKEGKTVVSRTPLAVDGESLVFAGPLKNGQKVQFGFSNASSVISGAEHISKIINQKPAQAIYIYSSVARKTLLGKVLENEFKSFESIAPTAGFFTYAEFYSTTADNALLNCTTTVLILSEEQTETNNTVQTHDAKNTNLDNVTFKALTHFIEQTSLELSENAHLLEEYKDVVDQSSLVSKADKNGVITYVNDNFCATSQYAREELLGSNHNIIRDKSMSSFLFKKLWSTILQGKIWKGLISNRAKDGSIYFVDATIMPIFNVAGDIKEFIAIRQDVTKQIESKKRIEEKEKLIKAIFDNQDSIVLFSSVSQGMLNANKKLFHYLDYKNFEDFKSHHDCICNLFIEEEGYIYPSKYPNWIDDTANDKSDKDKKAKILTKDGVVRTFNIMVKKIDDAYIINLYDITNLEEAILKANASEQSKSIFLANMSHEIRTPLNGILGFTDILTKKDLDKDASRYVEIIHKSGQTLLNVVNDILDFSKLESGELSLYKVESPLFLEMESAVSTFASLSKKKHINYYIYIDTNIPKTLVCDIQRLKQVINNLISNAIKFTPDGGKVQVEILLHSKNNGVAEISFSVKDSGIGIEKHKIKTIFQAFSQADNSISREYGGTGLGLAISNKYIKMMGSNIEVKSEKGKGSEFYFHVKLPIVNSSKAIKRELNLNNSNIVILSSQDKTNCAINEIVYTYLKAWEYDYRKINNIDEISNLDDVLIVCAKLFDQTPCMEALNKFKKLHLIYIEGSEDNFNCSHDKFHLIEQPMTGSMLFDNLITLINDNGNAHAPKAFTKSQSAQYSGNILIAEDNETNQILISTMLEERGLQYTIVNNGKEAVDEATRNSYEIILMDINMPIMDGVTATKLLRKNGYEKPIISLSANVIESDKKEFLKAGINQTLNKPIIPKRLDKILNDYLDVKNDVMTLDYDKIDVDLMGKLLSIPNRVIILKLLNSFYQTAATILQKLQSNNLDKNLLHSVKGVVGNLRLKKLYNLTVEFEKSVNEWEDGAHEKNRAIIISHVKELMRQIELIDK